MIHAILLSLLLLHEPVRDHGPGTSGGGLLTQSGEVLRPGAYSVSFRSDFTRYQRLSDDQIAAKTMDVDSDEPSFEAIRWALLQTVDLTFGATENLQIGFSFGYYRANDLREGEIDSTGAYTLSKLGDVTGMADWWVHGKYRMMRGPDGSLSVFGGIKLPLGSDTERGAGRVDPLDPPLQPGSGTFDFLLGVAYSRFLSSEVSLDASLSYTYRTREDDFKIGDLVLFGVAVAYRFTENVTTFPQPSVFLEVNVRHLFQNREGSAVEENSGGTTVFLSPGFRVAFTDRVAWSIAIQVPVIQDLNDVQQKTAFKVTTGLVLSF